VLSHVEQQSSRDRLWSPHKFSLTEHFPPYLQNFHLPLPHKCFTQHIIWMCVLREHHLGIHISFVVYTYLYNAVVLIIYISRMVMCVHFAATFWRYCHNERVSVFFLYLFRHVYVNCVILWCLQFIKLKVSQHYIPRVYLIIIMYRWRYVHISGRRCC